MSNFTLYNMDVIKALKKMEDNSVDTVVTSPPYWGLRDYGVDGQIGLEVHPKEYIAKMVEVLADVRRVLKKSGSVWLNVGDTYCSTSSQGFGALEGTSNYNKSIPHGRKRNAVFSGNWLQPKQKMLMPHRLAIALQDDGWVVRNDVVWHKPSHMPNSVRDRLTNSFEYVFLLVKSKKYFFDLDAIREPHISSDSKVEWHKTYLRTNDTKLSGQQSGRKKEVELDGGAVIGYNPSGKNPGGAWAVGANLKKGGLHEYALKKGGYAAIRTGFKHCDDFWSINPKPYAEAHFACFPPALVEKCLKATAPKQVCVKCGKARERITEIDRTNAIKDFRPRFNSAHKRSLYANIIGVEIKTVGFSDCGCNAGWKSGVVLDPFVGSGTTLFVAQKLGLDGVGIELNAEYIPLIKKRLLGDQHQTSLNKNKVKVKK